MCAHGRLQTSLLQAPEAKLADDRVAKEQGHVEEVD